MLLCFFIGVLCLYSVSSANNSPVQLGDDSDGYFPRAEWSDTFDWKLLKAFSNGSGNVLISPISLKLVLALLYEGSGGITEKEFQTVLQFDTQKELVRKKYQQILESLQPSERNEYILNLGTRIFLDSGLSPQQNFASKASHNYRTDIEQTNFSIPVEASKAINSWIDKLTNGKVPTLVSSGDLQDAIMILANAIYFKGTWRHQFPKNRTSNGGFYVSPNEIVTVPYMSTIDTFYYYDSADLDAKILRLPYKGKNYSLFVVLPNSKGGLPELIKNINLQVLKRQLIFMDKVPVEVTLPKFKFSFQTRLTKTLQDFGLRQMFQNTASFPGIARSQAGTIPNLLRMLVVSDIIQKTGIEVDEEGSVVYAATEIQVGNKFGEVVYVFNATHPFVFFLEEANTGSILFLGKVENPLQNRAVPLPSRFGDNEDVKPQPLANTPDLQPQNLERDAIIRRFNYFDLELLKEFAESPGNVFISPASIKTTLALILEGAKGATAQEIGNALRIEDIHQKDTREILERLLFDLNDRSPHTVLEASSAVFVSNKHRLIPAYEKQVAKYYKALVKSVDFSNVNEAAAIINSWGYNATAGLIPQLITNQHIDPDTSLILANALYFKGQWKIEFDPRSTKEKCFQSPTRGCVSTPLMQVTDTFNYNFNIELNAHAIELSYQDDKYAMLILLPTNGNNVKTLARDMQHAQLHNVIDALRPTELILEIPKFEIEYSTDLVDALRPLKIQEVFGPRANLSGIVAQDNIKVNNIIHKTKVEVNEQGTKAAAATSAVVIPLMGSTAQRIIADVPFIFFIYHKESRNILFEGVFKEPQVQAPQPAPARYYPQSDPNFSRYNLGKAAVSYDRY